MGLKGMGPGDRQTDTLGVGGLHSLPIHVHNSHIGITIHFFIFIGKLNTITCEVLMKGVTYSKQSIKG